MTCYLLVVGVYVNCSIRQQWQLIEPDSFPVHRIRSVDLYNVNVGFAIDRPARF